MTLENRRNTLSVHDFMFWVQRQIGDRYVEGQEVDLTSQDPAVWDLSELIQWGARQVGVYMPDGANEQIAYAEVQNTTLTVEEGLRTRGAMLWAAPNKIAISLGRNRTIEGVNGRVGLIRNVSALRFTKAAQIPGIRYK